jgi:hypothetical protein
MFTSANYQLILAFGEKDIGHPAITEYLSFTVQGKWRNRKIISEKKQTFYGKYLPVRRTDKESIFVGQSDKTDTFQELWYSVEKQNITGIFSVMAGWPISFSPNAKHEVKRKQENVATKADKRKYEDKLIYKNDLY